MGLLKEFKEFSLRGNVMDIAVGLIVGAAFGGIVTSFVADIIMPPIGLLIGGVDFSDLKFIIRSAEIDAAGKVAKEAVSVNYGKFIQTVLNFFIIASAVFMMIKGMNSLKKKEEVKAEAVPIIREEIILLSQIRDLLEKKQ